jgi:hypothetical protein
MTHSLTHSLTHAVTHPKTHPVTVQTRDRAGQSGEEVWVRSWSPHTPGHAVLSAPRTLGALSGVDRVELACPGVRSGGLIITREQAHRLLVMPCRCCFGLPAPRIDAGFGRA